MAHRVAIFGGGVAGLTAAHELACFGTDLEITVYERNPVSGGKARSFPKRGTGTNGNAPLPGEHGFRFFPSYYRHVIDTMERIPFGRDGATVADNLVSAGQTHIARVAGPAVPLPNQLPQNVRDWANVLSFPGQVDIPVTETGRFLTRMLQLFAASDARRFSVYEGQSWFDFVGAAGASEDYRKYLADGLNQRTVAASGKDVSARTVGITLLRIMADWMKPGVSIDRVLDGPTSDRWIAPWCEELARRGVRFEMGTVLERLDRPPQGPVQGARIRRRDGAHTVTADAYVLAAPLDEARAVAEASGLIGGAEDVGLDGMPRLSADWMNGIQFYLDGRFDLAPGHVIYADSPCALTSITQDQFWKGFDVGTIGSGNIKSILSVDISDWDEPCGPDGRPAKEMTRVQVKEEVLRQVQAHVESSYGVSLPGVVDWYLDPAVKELPAGSSPRLSNQEALFINRVGSWWARPTARTGVENLFLAADYVRTLTDLATMEAANEAGRRASRGVLALLGQDEYQVEYFDFSEPSFLGEMRENDQQLCGPVPDLGNTDLYTGPPPQRSFGPIPVPSWWPFNG